MSRVKDCWTANHCYSAYSNEGPWGQLHVYDRLFLWRLSEYHILPCQPRGHVIHRGFFTIQEHETIRQYIEVGRSWLKYSHRTGPKPDPCWMLLTRNVRSSSSRLLKVSERDWSKDTNSMAECERGGCGPRAYGIIPISGYLQIAGFLRTNIFIDQLEVNTI